MLAVLPIVIGVCSEMGHTPPLLPWPQKTSAIRQVTMSHNTATNNPILGISTTTASNNLYLGISTAATELAILAMMDRSLIAFTNAMKAVAQQLLGDSVPSIPTFMVSKRDQITATMKGL